MLGKSLRRGLIFLLFILIISGTQLPFRYVSADNNTNESEGTMQPIPIPVWPLDSNFRVLTPNVSCVSPVGMNNRLIAYYVNSTHSLSIRISLYVSCSNISGYRDQFQSNYSLEGRALRESIFVMSPNITKLSENYTKVVVPVKIYTTLLYPYPLEIRTKNLNINYDTYNSTYLKVEVDISNTTVSPMMEWTLGGSDPAYYGLPREIKINFLIDKHTGEAYLLDNGAKKYVGVLPLYLPEFNVKEYLVGIQGNMKELIKTIKSNPWIVENVLQKAKLANSTMEQDKIISQTVLKFVNEIFGKGYMYLGIPFNVTSGERLYTISPYIEFHRILPVAYVNNDLVLTKQNLTKVAIEEYLTSNNTEKIIQLINSTINIRRMPIPRLSTNTFVSTSVPIQPGDLIVLPLPERYTSQLNATYVYIYIPHNAKRYLHVTYNPQAFNPNKTIEEWKKTSSFIYVLRSETAGNISRFLYSSLTSGTLNYTLLDGIYYQLSSEISSYLPTISPSSKEVTTISSELPQSTSTTSPGKSSREGKGGICGPASLLPLALIPAWLWRKRK
ncbi:hypothetical protein [Thermococcus sp. Bubb.Bath]|uniref:hypothetical protein n=1 Tax=Thermococcus sp. Bubb.Bath TaxID=1638242 RepID=UPI00143BC074|nr:hypothetical protein [Thermococcus sp. Bubb.Bath]NJF24478.1 hypothetical protein [Thermococcus sp. Bubb.Bath]